MRYVFTIVSLLLLLNAAHSQNYIGLHRRAIVVDTHNDCISDAALAGKDLGVSLSTGHSDYFRWKKGGLDVQFFSIYTGSTPRRVEGFFHDAMEEIDTFNHLILRHPDRFSFVTDYKQIKTRAHKSQIVSFIGVEGGHMIENSLDKLDSLAERGMRYLTLTWNNSNDWATSAMDESGAGVKLERKGLTDFGKKVVARLNERGVMVDLSHVGVQTFYDVLAVTAKPVILTHSSVYSLCPVFRNVNDDQIRAIAKNKGVICINFYSGFISKEYAIDPKEENRPSVKEVVDHIDYIAKLVGVDYIGLGADYDGVGSLPKGLEDVSCYPAITSELKARGYSNSSIKKILGGNVLRVFKANAQ